MARVLVFGDSITWGSWDPAGGGWVGRLREAGCNRVDRSNPEQGDYTAVYNCGVSGDKVADVLARIKPEAEARDPAAIVLAVGINDVPHGDYPGTPFDELLPSFLDLVDRARDLATDVVVVTPTNVDMKRREHDYDMNDIASVVDAVDGCAYERSLPLVRVFGLMTDEDLESDGLHPGPSGHRKLFEAISPVVFGLPSLNG